MTETREERLVRLNLSVAFAKAALTQARWSWLGGAVSFVGAFLAWKDPSEVGSLGGALISFAGLGFVVWCGVETRRLVRKSQRLMKGPE